MKAALWILVAATAVVALWFIAELLHGLGVV
jgi:hypothetical protein